MKRKLIVLVCAFLMVFSMPLFAASLGDPFDGAGLKNSNWRWQSEPDEWDVGETTAGWLHFAPKINQNLWSSDTSIRLYQETSLGEFDVETHVVMDYQGSCIVAGLVALGSTENNWTTLKFWGRAADAILQWQHKANSIVNQVPGYTEPAGRVEAYLRLAKDSDNYMAWWKKEEGDDWIEIKPDAPIVLTPPIQIGIYGGICAGAGEGTIEYEYFKDLLNPYAIEPAEKMSATWGQIKSGY